MKKETRITQQSISDHTYQNLSLQNMSLTTATANPGTPINLKTSTHKSFNFTTVPNAQPSGIQIVSNFVVPNPICSDSCKF